MLKRLAVKTGETANLAVAKRFNLVAETRAAELRARVDRFFVLTDRATRRLAHLRRVAQTRDLARSADALDAYVRARNAARAEADRIGFRC